MNANNTRTLDLWTEAQRRELLKQVAKLPDPRGMAWRLSDDAFRALIEAERTRTGEYQLSERHRHTAVATTLIRYGMVEVRGQYLGSYGVQVRERALALIREGERI